MKCGTLIVGVGSHWSERDGLGLEVAEAVREFNLPDVEVMNCGGDWFALLDWWAERERVFIVDAIVDDRAGEGSIIDYDLLQSNFEFSQGRTSSHGFNIVEVIKMARQLERLPAYLHLLGLAVPTPKMEQRKSKEWNRQKKNLVTYLKNQIEERNRA